MKYVYNIIKSRRKTLAIEVKRPNLVLVRAPYRCSTKRIENLLSANKQWITKRLEYYRNNPGLPEATFICGSDVWLLGESYTVTAQPGDKRVIRLHDSELQFSKPDYQNGDEVSALQRWYRNFAHQYFIERADTLHRNSPVKLPPCHCKVRKMKRQWGNCSRHGEIKLNLALIQYPPECIDYVIFHEMCHLLHFNHSAAFYSLLQQLCPDWRALKQQLETFSP